MPSYAAILGHQPHLSRAELIACVPDLVERTPMDPGILLFDSQLDLTGERFSRLGGTVALARAVSTSAVTLEDVPRLLQNEVAGVKGQIVFSLRGINLPPRTMRELYRRCKDHLRRNGRAVRYVGSDRRPAASVLLHDAGLLDSSSGCELLLIAPPKRGDDEAQEGQPDVWIGRTVAAQDVEAYSKRDMEKPARDTRTGLLPPKLAQMLLNFGNWLATSGQRPAASSAKNMDATALLRYQPTTSPVVYDPFCGTGVIPMECVLRGMPVLASDLSQRAVSAGTANLEWLRREEDIRKGDVPSAVWKQDARKPFDWSTAKRAGIKDLPDVIVTETSLGTNFEKRPTLKEVSAEKTENEKLQAEFLENAARELPGVPIVCTWPVWYSSKGQTSLERIWDVLHGLGYSATLPPGVEPERPGRLSLLYRRKDQVVGREVVMLKHRVR